MAPRPAMRQRLAAVAALILGPVVIAYAAYVLVDDFPLGLAVLGGAMLALAAGWYGVLRRGAARTIGLAVAAVALIGAVAAMLGGDHGIAAALAIVVGALATVSFGKEAYRAHVPLPGVPRPSRPALLYNPKSGGGKAERFDLAKEAEARGITPIELTPGSDLEALARGAVADGADALAMAGGDGSQAIVAAVASELGLPYACVPAGTRNHFALDLGVDRDDVVGALDAFVDGGERVVDLGDVNGQVFVNNVSLGLYAEAVARPGYRDAKLKTLLDTVPDVIGPDGRGPELTWTGPGGHSHRSGAAVLVSNNRYRLGSAVGSGTRPRIDDGLLGVTVFSAPTEGGSPARPQRPWREWTAPEFTVDADGPVPAGVDGESVTLEPPLRFSIRSRVLRVRVPRSHPGASPSAVSPDNPRDGVRGLFGIAAGRAWRERNDRDHEQEG